MEHSIKRWKIKVDSFDEFYKSLTDTFEEGISKDGNTIVFDNQYGKFLYEHFLLPGNITLYKMKGIALKTFYIEREFVPTAKYYIFLFTLGDNSFVHRFSDKEIEREIEVGLTSRQSVLYFSSDIPSLLRTIPTKVEKNTLYIIMPYNLLDKKLFFLPENENTLNKFTVGKLKGHAAMDTKMIDAIRSILDSQLSPEINQIYLMGTVYQLVALLMNTIEQQNKKLIKETDIIESARLMQIKNLLINDFSEPCPPIEDMAKMAYMSVAKFKTSFKKLFKMSYYQYYQHYRLLAARELLNIGTSVKDTAFSVGFSDPANFSTAFKKKFNVMPSDLIN